MMTICSVANIELIAYSHLRGHLGGYLKIPPKKYHQYRIEIYDSLFETKGIVDERQRKGIFPWLIEANPFA